MQLRIQHPIIRLIRIRVNSPANADSEEVSHGDQGNWDGCQLSDVCFLSLRFFLIATDWLVWKQVSPEAIQSPPCFIKQRSSHLQFCRTTSVQESSWLFGLKIESPNGLGLRLSKYWVTSSFGSQQSTWGAYGRCTNYSCLFLLGLEPEQSPFELC